MNTHVVENSTEVKPSICNRVSGWDNNDKDIQGYLQV